MELPYRGTVMNAFIKAQFRYCPIVRMFHSHSLSNRIYRIHGCCLIIYNNKILLIYNNKILLAVSINDNFVSMDYNIHVLAFEMHKVANGMSEIFESSVSSHYSLRHTSQHVVNPIHSVFICTELAWYLEKLGANSL